MTAGIEHTAIPDSVVRGEELSGHTTLKLGGPADYFARPTSMEQLAQVTGWARENGIPVMILGGGSNLLFRDEGYRGMVVNLTHMNTKATIVSESASGDVLMSVPAGGRLPVLCSRASRDGLSGLLFASGIPGTVGGALFMNAGTHEGSMSDVIESITAMLPDGKIETFEKDMLNPSYRHMEIIDPPCPVGEMIFTECMVRLSRGDSTELQEESRKRLAKRKAIQPLGTFNAGSFFKNPAGNQSAGALIDAVGLKGFSVGNATVSEKHANFLVNTGNATAKQMLELMDHVRSRVLEEFGILLEPEVKIIG